MNSYAILRDSGVNEDRAPSLDDVLTAPLLGFEGQGKLIYRYIFA